jgi:hypothetical protein
MSIVTIVIRVCPLDIIIVVITDVVPKVRGIYNRVLIEMSIRVERHHCGNRMKLTDWPFLVVRLRRVATVRPLICRASLGWVLITASTAQAAFSSDILIRGIKSSGELNLSGWT